MEPQQAAASASASMNQLKFTMAKSGPADSLTTCFPPRPSPVELHKPTPGPHQHHFLSPATAERMALAVKLARRDLHRALAHRACPHGASLPGSPVHWQPWQVVSSFSL